MPAWLWEGVLVLLAANEIGGWAEWLARRLVRWSAHVRYANSPYRSDMAEELERVVIDRPGQVLKLFTAGCFALAAVRAWLARLPVRPAAGRLRLAAATYAGTVTLARTITATAALTLYSALTLYAALPGGGTSAGPAHGTIDPVVSIRQPVSTVDCHAFAGSCLYPVSGSSTSVASNPNLDILVLVVPVNPPGGGWWIQLPTAQVLPSGTWASIGSVAEPALSGDTFELEAIVVRANATYGGIRLRTMFKDVKPILDPRKIHGLVAESSAISLRVAG